jgi:hypothetical protein
MRVLVIVIAFVLGALVGIAAAVIVGRFWIYPEVTKEKYDYGHGVGALQAQVEIAARIPDVLGRDVDPNEAKRWLFSAKTESVVVVTRHGVKTLRLCCDGSEPMPDQ